MTIRLPVVGVMGSGTRARRSLAVPLGRGLAELPVHLLTGGGGGVMNSVSQAFALVTGRAGLVIGVLPAERGSEGHSTPPGYPNPWVEVAVRTHLEGKGDDGGGPNSRNHVNVLSSDVIVALPGSAGTASEVAMAVRYGRPLVLLGDLGRAKSLPETVMTAETPAEALSCVRDSLFSR